MIPTIEGVHGVLPDHLERSNSGFSKVRSSLVCNKARNGERNTRPFPKANLGSMELDKSRGNGYYRQTGGNGVSHVMFLLLMLMSLPRSVFAILTSQQPSSFVLGSMLNSRAPNQTSPLLECLQVSAPVLTPPKPTCQQVLMVHTFGWSYGMPYVGQYTPPDCDFNRVTMNFTVTSAGRQYDRLALMFLNDTEVFRTSTAEPTQNGIIWTYVKDMSNFISLFKDPQKIIFDLGNLVDDTYTGSWNTTLTATFFTADDDIDAADQIIPISARQSSADKPSQFVVPDTKAINTVALPQNIKKAVFSIAACGQGAEEFWWSNVLSSDTQVFGNEMILYGYSPFRELQLYIDGTMAGVAWPFPVIFTGGIVPGFWRPVVGIDAFDLREDEIDITPFAPLLSDGGEHSFEVRVSGISDDGRGNGNLTETVGSNWVVTGKIFLWLDQNGTVTTGSLPEIDAPPPTLDIASSTQKRTNGTVLSLDYSVNVARSLWVSSTIQTSAGSQTVGWKQNLKFSNSGQFSNGGNDQLNTQSTTGRDSSTNGYSKAIDYPLCVNSTYQVLSGGNFTIDGTLSRGKNVQKIGDLAFPSELKTFSKAPEYGSSFAGTSISESQNGTAHYLGAPSLKKSFGSGTTEQYYSLDGIDSKTGTGTELYRRHVLAVNDSIVLDEGTYGDGQQMQSSRSTQETGDHVFAELGIKAMLGRGPK